MLIHLFWSFLYSLFRFVGLPAIFTVPKMRLRPHWLKTTSPFSGGVVRRRKIFGGVSTAAFPGTTYIFSWCHLTEKIERVNRLPAGHKSTSGERKSTSRSQIRAIFLVKTKQWRLTVLWQVSRRAFSVNFKLIFKGTGLPEESSPNRAWDISERTPASLGPMHLFIIPVAGSGKDGFNPDSHSQRLKVPP